ncbi:MAG TPA: PhzF family phenazine biosynthesis protein [Thermomicrobiales bacterium]|nr:PhzF family phenazine biosynthesis protein [Thermomicrobiales bacterium]
MTSIGYVTVDVFTSSRFGGNPLAVIPDARGLSDDAMAAIAREFNYSETTFVLPPADPANTARVRIFTPTSELPFAGHPNVGTGYVLGRLGSLFDRPITDALRFEENAGLVVVELIRDGAEVAGATITAPQSLSLGPELDAAEVAECIGLPPSAILTTHHQPQYASVGLPFLCVEIGDLDSLGRAVPNTMQFRAAQDELPDRALEFNVFAYTETSTNPLSVRARMFAPLDGVPEDPATGSAAGALGAFLTHLRPEADLELTFPILQGVEMGRPSRIDLAVRKGRGVIERVGISGRCVDVMRGTFEL